MQDSQAIRIVQPQNREPYKALLVDDSPTVSQAIGGSLAELGLQVRYAITGPEALDVATEWLPDCILLDVELPGMSGYEVIAALKEDEPTAEIPVIFLTGRDTLKDKIRGLTLGAHDYLSISCEQPELIARVKSALRIKTLQDDLREANEALKRLATTDPVTGLSNRMHLNESLERLSSVADRYGRPLSVVMADLDHFKLINDTYGHDGGDKALKAFAEVLLRCSRQADVAGRFGGEEFLVICPETEVGGAAVLAGRIRAATEEEVGAILGDKAVTSSFGCAQMLPGETTQELLRRTDAALYAAKRGGRNRVCLARSPVRQDAS